MPPTPILGYRDIFGSKLIDAIIEEGFKVVLANNPDPNLNTLKSRQLENIMVGRQDPRDKPRRRPWHLRKSQEDPRFIATIWINNHPSRPEINHTNWLIDIWGAEDQEVAKALVEELAERFGAEVLSILHGWPSPRYVRRDTHH